MIDYVIPVIESWLPIWEACLVPVFALHIVAFVGLFIHCLLRR